MRVSFFAKTFSTLASRPTNAVVLSARREHRRRRHEPSSGERSDYASVAAHYRIKEHETGRGHSHSLKIKSEGAYGSLDPRLLRAKSPRNLQYRQRQSSGSDHVELRGRYRRFIDRKTTDQITENEDKLSLGWGREARRT